MKNALLFALLVLTPSCTHSSLLDVHDKENVAKFLVKAQTCEGSVYIHPNIQSPAKVISIDDSILCFIHLDNGNQYKIKTNQVRFIVLKDENRSLRDGAIVGALTLGTLGAVLYGKYDSEYLFSKTKSEPIKGALYFGFVGVVLGGMFGSMGSSELEYKITTHKESKNSE